MPEGEESSQSEDDDDIGRKGRKRKGKMEEKVAWLFSHEHDTEEKKLLEAICSNLYIKGNIWYKVSEFLMYFQLPLYTLAN